jgi:hypothetical protein
MRMQKLLPATSNIKDKFHKHNNEQKKLDTEEYELDKCICIWFNSEKNILIYSVRHHLLLGGHSDQNREPGEVMVLITMVLVPKADYTGMFTLKV